MPRRLALIVLLLAVTLAIWFFRGNAPGVPPIAAPAAQSHEAASAPAQTASEPAPRREQIAAQDALLVVICRAKETGVALAGQLVHLYGGEPKEGRIPEGTGPHGRLGELLVTGSDGRVEYEIQSGTAAKLASYSPIGANANGSRDIAALAPGERREVVLELATQDDAHFFGRVTAHDSKQPIAAAEVRGGPRELATDADGRFDLPYATWSPTRLTIVARGYGECVVVAQAGHETPGQALVLELEHSCTLVGILKDGGSGNYVLQAVTEGYRLTEQDPSRLTGMAFDAEDRSWRADFDATGRAEIPGLPPNAPLRVSVLDGRKTLVELAERVTILQGATREVELRASSTCRLSGVVRDDAGQPVADLTLWLLRAGHGAGLYLNSYEDAQRVGTAKTDASGRFAIEKVSLGQWRLGPEAKDREDGGAVPADAIAPVAQLVDVREGEAQHEVELVVHRGLTITGTVLDPDGKAVARVGVMGCAAQTYVNANSTDDGRFVLGPLQPGTFVLDAEPFGSGFARSAQVTVDAGARDVVLQLRRAGRLAGRVADSSSGEGVIAEIAVSIPADPQAGIHMPTSEPDGTFVLEGMLPGSYALAAATTDGRVGILRGVELAAGSDLHDLLISVQPGARVRVRYEGAQGYCSAQVVQDGVVVATDGVEKGTSKTFSGPAGSVKVVCRLGGNGKELVRELVLKAGEERELVFKDEN
jgi:hypothetical protein